jgi:hypothetical protein
MKIRVEFEINGKIIADEHAWSSKEARYFKGNMPLAIICHAIKMVRKCRPAIAQALLEGE